MSDLATLQAILGISFKDDSLLQQALIHRSYLNENPALHLVSNERLEFLGDAVLGFVVANELYCRFPDFSEGELTNLRSALVRGDTLSRIALSLHLGDYLYLGHGEEESGGRTRSRNLSCVLEAVIGAVFVDQGFDVARNFTLNILGSKLEQAATEKSQSDYKSRLQQIIQSESKTDPCLSYRRGGWPRPCQGFHRGGVGRRRQCSAGAVAEANGQQRWMQQGKR